MEQITKIDLFPFFRAFFSDDMTWDMLTDSAKKQHAFMLNRFLAIKRPEYIQCLNKFHSVHVINALHQEFKSKGSPPSWMYTKTTKSGTQAKEIDLSKYPVEIIQRFIYYHQLEKESFALVIDLHAKEVIVELDKYLAQWNQVAKPQKITKKNAK